MNKRLPTLEYDRDTPIGFSVDGALLRELGERLIGRPEIALAEVVKNSFDADARHCEINFGPGFIEIVDDGNGMSQSEFLRFWMRIGSTHKKNLEFSPRFQRALTGQKGIGRLSVQFLGERLVLHSRSQVKSEPAIRASVDWSEALKQAELVDATAKVRLDAKPPKFANDSLHGTRLRIESTVQDWEEPETLKQLAQQIWMLQPPLAGGPDDEDFGLQVEVKGLPEDAEHIFKAQMGAVLDLWRARITGRIEKGRSNGVCRVTVEIREPTLVSDGGIAKFEQSFDIERGRIDKASFEIRVFDLKHRQAHGISVHHARDYFEEHGGVHVLDSGFRLPYYGQKSSDWLELESDSARRLNLSSLLPDELHIGRAMLELPRRSQLYGVVRVNTGREQRQAPDDGKSEFLKISPGRDRLLDGPAFETLRKAVRQSIDYFATRRALLKERYAAAEVRRKGSAIERVSGLTAYLQSVETKLPAPIFRELEERAVAAQQSIDAADELAKQHRVMLGTLATAGMAALAIDHELRRELGRLRALIDKSEHKFQKHPELVELLSQLSAWAKATDEGWRIFSPLMTEESRQDKKPYRVKAIIDGAVRSTRRFLEGIQVRRSDVDEDLLLPRATAATWHAIFQNVLINAVNAQLDSGSPLIACRTEQHGKRALLYVQDRGAGLGVSLEDSGVLFEPFERRLKLSADRKGLGLGGAGLGLTIVRMLAESAGCKAYFVEPDHGFTTAFCLEWRINVRNS